MSNLFPFSLTKHCEALIKSLGMSLHKAFCFQKSDIKIITEQSCGLGKKRSFLKRPKNVVDMLDMQKVRFKVLFKIYYVLQFHVDFEYGS